MVRIEAQELVLERIARYPIADRCPSCLRAEHAEVLPMDLDIARMIRFFQDALATD